MARSSNETVEVSANNERRMCGLAKDDDNDDLREDVTELFGRHVEDPIEVDGNGNDAAGAKKERMTTSAHVLLPRLCGSISRSSKKGPKVRRSGMPLAASTAISSTQLSLVVALATSLVIGINVLRGMRKLT
jgi:hypothetical protein